MFEETLSAPEPGPTPPLPPISEQEASPEKRNLWNATKRLGQSAILMAEILPITNEGSRLAIFGATEALTHNAIASGLALGLSTFIIESAGGLAAASLFETEASRKVFNTINEKAKKIGVPTDKKLSKAAKAGWTFMGGTVVGLALEQREDPDRTLRQNRRYNFYTSAWQAGVLAVIGTLMAEGINIGIEDPQKGLLIAGIIAGTVALGGKGRKLINKYRNKK